MFVMDYADGEWKRGEISSYGPMTFSPAMMSLHYGQAIFEDETFASKTVAWPCSSGENIKRFNFSASTGMPSS